MGLLQQAVWRRATVQTPLSRTRIVQNLQGKTDFVEAMQHESMPSALAPAPARKAAAGAAAPAQKAAVGEEISE